MINRRCYFFLLLLIISTELFATPDDSISTTRKYKTSLNYIYEKDCIYRRPEKFKLDTSVAEVHHVNPALDLHHNYLGTNGSASEPQFFNLPDPVYTFTSVRSYDLQMLHSDSTKYFHTNKRFTELDYHLGNFKEQRIALLHTQNIKQNWNAGFDFERQGLKDYMNYSNTFKSKFEVYTWYYTPNRRYNLFANAMWNTVKNGVNGGLSSDSLFDNTNVTNLGIKGLAYNISNATQSVRKKSFLLSQFYDLRSPGNDSVGRLKSTLRLQYKISFERKSFTYSDPDPDSSYYTNFYFGAATYDSLHSDELRNRVALQFLGNSSDSSSFFRNLSTGIFAEHQHMDYSQRSDTSWKNISAGGNILIRKDSSSAEIFAEGIYVIDGMDEGSYRTDLKLFTPEYSFGRFGISLNYSESPADLVYRWYEGNNFIWKNNFKSQNIFKSGINYELKKYRFYVEANLMRIENYVFLNIDSRPYQFIETVSVRQITLIKNFKLGYWHFDNKLYFQKNDYPGIIHLPEFISDQSIYFEKYYFNKALLAAFGVSGNYNSSYNSNAFMPANALFYLQNEIKTGGYVRLDLFANLQIKTARVFLNLENAADGLFKQSYYLTPHYPMPGRIFKFGIIWRFFDQ